MCYQKKRLSRSDIHNRSYPQMLPMRRLSRSDIKHRSCLQMLPMRRLNQSNIQYRPYLHLLPREDSVNPIYNTDPIYICYHEKTQSIRYTIPALSTYGTMRRLSRSDIQYWRYLPMFEWEDSVHQIYNADPIYICYQEKTQSIRYTIPTLSTYITHEKTQSIRYTIPTLSTYVTMRRLNQSDIQYRPYLHMLPREDPVNPIYNTDPIYICYHEKTQPIRYTIPTLSTYITHEKTQSIRYTIPTLSTYVTMRRLSPSDIQHRHYLYMLPKEDSVDHIYNTTLSTYVTLGWLSRSDVQYRPYQHMVPWEDSIDQIYNTGPIYIWHNAKTQSIRYTILTLSTYVWMRRLSSSDIQYRPYLHMLPWEDSINQIYNTDPICICYQEKTQSIRYTIPTLSTYVTMRRLNQSDIQYRPYLHILPMRRLSLSDIQYRPYLHMLPWEDSVHQIYNTDIIYICYRKKTQWIIYTIRPYLHMLLWDDSADQMYNIDHINIWYREKTQSIR